MSKFKCLLKINLQKSRRRTSHSAQVSSWPTLGQTPPTLQRFLEFSRIFPTVVFQRLWMVPSPLSLTLRMWLRISPRNWRQCTGTSTPHVSKTQISKPSVVCCFLFCLLQNFLRQYKFASLLLFLLFHKAWHCSLQCFEKRFRKDRLLWLVTSVPIPGPGIFRNTCREREISLLSRTRPISTWGPRIPPAVGRWLYTAGHTNLSYCYRGVNRNWRKTPLT